MNMRFIYLFLNGHSQWERAPSEFTQLFVKDIVKGYINKNNSRLFKSLSKII